MIQLKHFIKNLEPGWFGWTMGTGMVSVLLVRMPYNFRGLEYIAMTVAISDLALFVLILAGNLIRYFAWPTSLFNTVLRDPLQSCHLAMFSISLSTLLDLFCYLLAPKLDSTNVVAEVGFWICCVVAISICLAVMLFTFTLTPHEMTSVSNLPALPITAVMVAAGSGAVVTSILPLDSPALPRIIVTSCVLLGIGFPFSSMICVLYIRRLFIYKWPRKQEIPAVFVIIGPIAQGAFAVMNLGLSWKQMGDVIYSIGLFFGLLIWGWTLMLVGIAFSGTAIQFKHGYTFSLGWWASTYPLGTFGICSGFLGAKLDITFFSVIAIVDSLLVIFCWIVLSALTIRLAFFMNYLPRYGDSA